MNPDLPSLQPVLERISGKLTRLRGLTRPEAFVQSLEHKLKIELTHGSTAMEGNTLTLRETQLLIDEGIVPQGSKRVREIYETVNHHKAVLMVQDLVRAGKECGEPEICRVHRVVMANIDDQCSGSDRLDRVTGAPLQPLRPDLVPEAMRELSGWINIWTCKRR